MRKTHTKELFFNLNELKKYHELVNMTGKELYEKHGIKREELIFGVEVPMSDDRSVEISWRAGSELNEKAQLSVQLVNSNGRIIADASEDYDNTKILESFTVTDETLHMDPEDCLTGETVDTPRGHFRVADMGMEQMENAGFRYHHLSKDHQWVILSDGERAYAISMTEACTACYNQYIVAIKLARCAVPLLCDNGQEGQYTAFIDSEWLLGNCQEAFEEYGGFLEFLNEYTSEDSNDIISNAILAHAVLFVYDPDEDEPFSFPNKNGWKYKAFADAISGIINETNIEAAKAIDCLLNL